MDLLVPTVLLEISGLLDTTSEACSQKIVVILIVDHIGNDAGFGFCIQYYIFKTTDFDVPIIVLSYYDIMYTH